MIQDNSIIQGDCLEIMKSIPDKSIDLVLTDPPYGIAYQSAWRTDKTQWKPKIENDGEPFIKWLPDTFRVVKDGGRLMCFCRWDVQEVFRVAIESAGFIVKSQIVWDKVIHGMGDLTAEFSPRHEIILYATKGRYEFQGKRPTTIQKYRRVLPEELKHPNEKPVELLKALMIPITQEFDLILDPFAGSGSTLVTAKKLDRRYIGIEISPEYCKIAEQRIANTGVQAEMNLCKA